MSNLDQRQPLWLTEPVLLNDLNGEDLTRIFTGYATIAVSLLDHMVYAAGHDEDELVECLEMNDQNVEDFWFAPGPVGLELLD